MKIEDGRRVRIQFKLKADGKVVEDSIAEYFHGAGKMLPGLEKALAGAQAGDERTGVIPAAETLPTKTIPRREFPEDAKLEQGSTFVAKGPDGKDVKFHVARVDADQVLVQFDHPLAGKDLAYEVKVLSVTDPTPPPLPGDALVAEEED